LPEFVDTGCFAVKHHLQIGFVRIGIQILSQLTVDLISLDRLIVLEARLHLHNLRLHLLHVLFILLYLLLHISFACLQLPLEFVTLRLHQNFSLFLRFLDLFFHVFSHLGGLFAIVLLTLFQLFDDLKRVQVCLMALLLQLHNILRSWEQILLQLHFIRVDPLYILHHLCFLLLVIFYHLCFIPLVIFDKFFFLHLQIFIVLLKLHKIALDFLYDFFLDCHSGHFDT
jgi:hypothetical protein